MSKKNFIFCAIFIVQNIHTMQKMVLNDTPPALQQEIAKIKKMVKDGPEGSTELMYAVDGFSQAAVTYCLEKYPHQIAQTNKNGIYPLHVAVIRQCLPAVQLLLVGNAPVNQETSRKQTCLMLACQKGNTDIVKCLLEHKADATKKSAEGFDALRDTLDSYKPQQQIIHMLQKAGADINQCDGEPRLHLAIQNRVLSALQMLIKCGADINYEAYINIGDSKCNIGTPFFFLLGCPKPMVEGARALIEAGADLDKRFIIDKQCFTWPIYQAIARAHIAYVAEDVEVENAYLTILQMMLNSKQGVNLNPEGSISALQCALFDFGASRYYVPAIRLLLFAGAKFSEIPPSALSPRKI